MIENAQRVRDCPCMRKRKYTQQSTHNILETCTELIDMFNENKRHKYEDAVPIIHNLVATCQITSNLVTLNLFNISKLLPNSTFDKQKFAAITIRLFEPSCTILLFTSGKMVLTGNKNYLDCILAIEHMTNILRTGIPGIDLHISPPEIQNIVGNTALCTSPDEYICLESILENHNVYCTFQKKMFPGLIFRPVGSPVVFLVFSSGKIVLTGAKSTADMYLGWCKYASVLKQYMKRRSEQGTRAKP